MTIALITALYSGYRFISRSAGTEDGYLVWALLPDVTGVAPRSRVMVSGVQVGMVEKIRLDEKSGKPRVDIRMRPSFKLYRDATVGKRASSFIGEYYVVLTPGTTAPGRELKNNDRITNMMEVTNFDTLQEQARDIMKDVREVTKTLKATVGSTNGQKRIDSILKDLAGIMAELNATVRENRRGVRQSIDNINKITQNTRPELAQILKNIREITSDIRALTGKSKSAKGEKKTGAIRSTAEKIDRAASSLESLLKHANSVAARIDRGEGTVGRLTKDERLINDVEEVVDGIGSFVGGIGRIQTVVGLRTDYNFLANTIKSYVSLRLQPSEDKYYLIEVVNDPRGLTSFEQIDVDTTNPNDPPHYREIRTVTTNAFRFSFQFAKRLGMFTGRFGIRESTGGIGIDTHLLDDRLEIRQDFFGFGEQVVPRWRVALSYEFIRKLWLLGGIDNIISSDRRDYFFGLQLRFTDNDLKSILPFTPSGALSR